MSGSLAPGAPAEAIRQLELVPHPEGGFYAVTWCAGEQVASPYGDGARRSVATCIYYFLSPTVPNGVPSADPVAAGMPVGWKPGVGVLHTNKSSTMHLLHHGTSRYILIRAAHPWGPYNPKKVPYELPEIRTVTMGANRAARQTLQLLVEGGWWKVSMLAPSASPSVPEPGAVDAKDEADGSGALISEVVTPGAFLF